eukprot:CAMPEP_0114584202 /NCGR_PEP_ID=MMETSP0125-20121206/7920_1 /TAXON_ID=485358 ORGANISM="Aristerostoma sp., Strain ATCC 50986" /NCGR_SAMPLE_ID=MMETSP0125 /ASSEMBLY_ACC=CAM_ASM_000245 /LENGTH=70 /DNA_ID=CAMNT_0001778393 /DNA_START=1741 /DNA_END=1953 /DNA_ORIENTATION=+
MCDDTYRRQALDVGSFINGDKVKCILSMKLENSPRGLVYFCEWHRRANGRRPKPSYVTKEELLNHAPALY